MEKIVKRRDIRRKGWTQKGGQRGPFRGRNGEGGWQVSRGVTGRRGQRREDVGWTEIREDDSINMYMLASVIKNSTRETLYSSLLYVWSLCITFEKNISQKIQFKVWR